MKKSNLLFICVVFVSLLFLFIGCSNKNENSFSFTSAGTDSQQEVFSENPERAFVVGFDAEYPPYGYMDNTGEYVGFDLDIAAEVCKRNNWTLVKQPIDWNSKDLELLSAKIDCIWNGFTITGREDKYIWSYPYVDNSIVFVVKNNSNINSKLDLKGKVVCTQSVSSDLSALESDENKDMLLNFKNLEQVADYNTAFMNLESGFFEAIAVDIGVAKYQLKGRENKYKILEEELSKEQYAIGFRSGNMALRDRVQKALKEIYIDGTFMEIAKKYNDFNLSDMVCFGSYIDQID